MSTQVESLPKTHNRILNALTRSEYERLAPHLDRINLGTGEILYHPD